jgi:AmmeMemoRadiSam system protein B
VRVVSISRSALGLRLAVAAVGGLTLGLVVWLVPLVESGTAPLSPEATHLGVKPPGAAYPLSHPLLFFDERAFAAAEAATAATPVEPMPDARGLLVPHHWVGGAFITTSLRDLVASRQVTRVILIGPNHTNAGGGAVLTSDLPWETPFGSAEADREAVATLATTGLVRLEPDVLTYEHSVAGIMPAVRRYLPEAKVVPLILRGGLSAVDVERLATALTPLMDDGTVVVAAVDFSHGLPAPVAQQRDGETLALLGAFDWTPLLHWGNEHLDSPASVAVLMETMSRLGAARFEVRGNSNSGEVTGDLASPVTSYIVGYFH